MPAPARRLAVAVAVAVALLSVLVSGYSDDGDGDLESFCETARRFEVDNPANALAAYDPADPAGAARLLRDAAHELDAWADDAPGETREDVEQLRDIAGELADVFDASSVDAARVAELEDRFDEVAVASARVVEFVRSDCSVDLDPTTTTTPG